MLQNYFDKYGHTCKLNLNKPFDKYKVNKSRFRLWFIEKSTISQNYILRRSNCRSHAVLRKEIVYHLENFPITIHPFSAITFYCEFIWMLVTFLWLHIIPLNMFKNLNIDRTWRHDPDFIEICFSTITFVDMVRRFFTGYVIRHCDSDEVVLDVRRISCHYLKSYFSIDFITCLPAFIKLLFSTDPNFCLAFELFSFLRFFRLASMLRIFKTVMHFFRCNENVSEILDTILTLWFIVHWVSCLSIVIGIVDSRYQPNRIQWFDDILTPDLTLSQQYVICLYRTVSILTGTGYKFNKIRKSESDLVYIIFIAILGHILTFVLIARADEIVAGLRSASAKYEEMLDEVSQYMKQKTCKQTTQDKIKTYYAYKYEKSFFSERAIMAAIPRILKQVVALQNAKFLLDNIIYFKQLPAAVAAQIVTHLAKSILLAGDIVYKKDENNKSVYFILHGTVAEFSANGREISHLQDGKQFGEGVLFADVGQHSCTMVAIETCELYKAKPGNIIALIDYCPDFIEHLEKVVKDRKEKSDTIDERYQQLTFRSSLSVEFAAYNDDSDIATKCKT